MVNAAWEGQSHRKKLWWRLVLGLRGERQMDPFSSLFPPKFPVQESSFLCVVQLELNSVNKVKRT